MDRSRVERANSLPMIHQGSPSSSVRGTRSIFRRRRSEENAFETNLQTPLTQSENPMKPMLAQMLRKSKNKALLASSGPLQPVSIPQPVRDFDSRLREEPEVLGRFLLWYLYHDLYECPDSPEGWFDQLPFAEIKDWMRLSEFIRNHPDDDLPGMRAVCADCVIPLSHVRDMIARYGQRERMAWTEVMEIQCWGRENSKSDIEITTAIEELLLNDRIICDGLTRLNELDATWHDAQEKIIRRIDSYLMEIIFPFLQLARKEKCKDLKRWLSDSSNLEMRADVHYHWNEVHRRRRTPSIAYSNLGEIPQFPNPFARKASLVSIMRLDPVSEDAVPPPSRSGFTFVSGRSTDESEDEAVPPNFGHYRMGSGMEPRKSYSAQGGFRSHSISHAPITSSRLPARMDSMSVDPLSMSPIEEKPTVSISPRTSTMTPAGVSLEDVQKATQKLAEKYKAVKEYKKELEKEILELEDDNYWLRRKLAEAEDEVSRYRNGDNNAGLYHITGEVLPYPGFNGKGLTAEDRPCHISGSAFPPPVERTEQTAKAM